VLALIVAAVLAAPLAAPAPASAAKTQESVFQDDRLLVSMGDQVRQRTLFELRSLGVDTIHSLVFWHKIAPRPHSRRRPRGFNPSDPADYPPGAWDAWDGLVRDSTALGIDVLLSPTGFVPAWASDCGSDAEVPDACRPDPRQYKRFVKAVGLRYSGLYRDENQGRHLLPAVHRWSIWNEPNQAGWLYPQRAIKDGRTVPEAPHIYRRLVYAAIGALRATGHRDDQVLLGETAPLGRRFGALGKLSMPPAEFYRELFCLDRRGRPFRGVDARLRDCRRFKRLRAEGITHHPYTRGAGRPPRAAAARDDVPITALGRLVRVLDQAAKRRRFPRDASIYLTEFGFQTKPPSRKFGVRPRAQAVYLNQSEWLAWRNPRVASFGWYELWDERAPGVYKTGLKFYGGRAKPAFDAYRLPIWVVRRPRYITVFGHVRPAEPGSRERVRIQNRPAGERRYKTVKSVTVAGPDGYFLTKLAPRSGRWRLVWRPEAGGRQFASRRASAAPR
jgi:hypothetical protein